MLAADYSQIELRIMAHLSGDAGLIQAFAENRDVHRATAAEVFGVAPELVSDEMRRAAKAINFGLIYGMSAFGLARQLKIDRSAAPSTSSAISRAIRRTRVHGAHARIGAQARLRRDAVRAAAVSFRDQRPNQARRQGAERAAINAPMQGTAADFIKRAMIATDAWIAHSAWMCA